MEHKAHDLLTSFLEEKGFTVKRSYTGTETAFRARFRATFGSGRPNVCAMCKYDALPEIGHDCGHNLIAEAGVAAGLGVKAALRSKCAPKGWLTIMGTPAEETIGGKVKLVENGAFEDVDIAMMVHPAPYTVLTSEVVACLEWRVTYTGEAAHVAGFPWEGVNALDAAVMAYTSISVLQQQMKPTWRVHGIITNGGAKPNIIPEKAAMEYFIRAPTRKEANIFGSKVRACLEAAVTATGCQLQIEEEPVLDDLQHNSLLGKCYSENYQSLGCQIQNSLEEAGVGSTDMGKVSYVVPSIHPLFKIGSGQMNHTREFTSVANTPKAHSETLVAAKAMAHSCIEILTTDGLLEQIRSEFEKQIEQKQQ